MFSDEVHCVAYWMNATIIDIGGDLEPTHIRGLGEAYATLRQSYPKGIVAIVIVQPDTPVSGADARAEGARMIKELGDGLLQMAVVIEERGVFAPLMRSVVRGINVFLRNSRLTLTDTVQDAVRDVSKHIELAMPKAAVEQELLAAIATVRRAFASTPERQARLSTNRRALSNSRA